MSTWNESLIVRINIEIDALPARGNIVWKILERFADVVTVITHPFT